MTTLQKVIKYLAMAFAVFLIVTIIGAVLGAAGLLGVLFTKDDSTKEVAIGDMKTYSITSEIHDLNIQINAADFYIKDGNAFSVESNLKNLEVFDKNGTLTIKDPTKIKLNTSNVYENAVLTIYIPAGAVFEKVSIHTGAGRFTVDSLSADTVDFELGAGDVSIDTLIAAKSADIEGGAGRITISGGALKNLDLEMGVGQLNLTSELTGKCRLDLGIGESDITLTGNREDYKLDLEKGIGNITVDGKSVSDYGSSGNGNAKVEINGGIGSIHVRFAQ